MKRRLSAITEVSAVAMMLVGLVRAQDIIELSSRYQTFTNENPDLCYRIEFKPNMTAPDPWDAHIAG